MESLSKKKLEYFFFFVVIERMPTVHNVLMNGLPTNRAGGDPHLLVNKVEIIPTIWTYVDLMNVKIK